MARVRDWSTASGNQELARRIKAYWSDRGHSIEVTVELVMQMHGATLYGVRSNLVDGMPPR